LDSSFALSTTSDQRLFFLPSLPYLSTLFFRSSSNQSTTSNLTASGMSKEELNALEQLRQAVSDVLGSMMPSAVLSAALANGTPLREVSDKLLPARSRPHLLYDVLHALLWLTPHPLWWTTQIQTERCVITQSIDQRVSCKVASCLRYGVRNVMQSDVLINTISTMLLYCHACHPPFSVRHQGGRTSE
jgi:hypothetical protein